MAVLKTYRDDPAVLANPDHYADCADCGGSGFAGPARTTECIHCEGTGILDVGTPIQYSLTPASPSFGSPVADSVANMRTLFQLPIGTGPTLLTQKQTVEHFDIIAEEFAELVESLFGEKVANAVAEQFAVVREQPTNGANLTRLADALGDVVITIYGMALHAGIPLDAVIAEQMRANLSKVDDDGRPVFNANGKFIKEGTNYVAPDVEGVLAAAPVPLTKMQKLMLAAQAELDRVAEMPLPDSPSETIPTPAIHALLDAAYGQDATQMQPTA